MNGKKKIDETVSREIIYMRNMGYEGDVIVKCISQLVIILRINQMRKTKPKKRGAIYWN